MFGGIDKEGIRETSQAIKKALQTLDSPARTAEHQILAQTFPSLVAKLEKQVTTATELFAKVTDATDTSQVSQYAQGEKLVAAMDFVAQARKTLEAAEKRKQDLTEIYKVSVPESSQLARPSGSAESKSNEVVNTKVLTGLERTLCQSPQT